MGERGRGKGYGSVVSTYEKHNTHTWLDKHTSTLLSFIFILLLISSYSSSSAFPAYLDAS